MASLSITALLAYFSNDNKSISRGENHYKSGHVTTFAYEDGILTGKVTTSMKNKDYSWLDHHAFLAANYRFSELCIVGESSESWLYLPLLSLTRLHIYMLVYFELLNQQILKDFYYHEDRIGSCQGICRPYCSRVFRILTLVTCPKSGQTLGLDLKFFDKFGAL